MTNRLSRSDNEQADPTAELSRLIATDPTQKSQLVEIMSIASMLGACVIGPNYRISDSWIRPLRFTELGEQVIDGVSKDRPRLKPNEVKFATFLTIGSHDGLVVDPTVTDIEALRKVLSVEITKRRLLFPYIFGRELHDLTAQLYAEKDDLDNKQSIALLKQLPHGVFQEGHTVVGPFGCTWSPETRLISPSRSVPGYLCSDERCSAIHSISLETADTAIHKARIAVESYVQKHHSPKQDENARIASTAALQEHNPYRLHCSVALIETLSDALSPEEFREAVDLLLRRELKADGKRTELSKQLGIVIGSPTEAVASLDRASLLHLALTFTDDAIIRAVDQAVSESRIKLSSYERRVRRFSRWAPTYHRLAAEIGPLGVRFTAPLSESIVAKKLFALLHHLYFESEVLEPDDLEYLLQPGKSLTAQELLGYAVHNLSPESVLRELVLGSRRAAVAAAEFLGVDDQAGGLVREDLLTRLLWKLGVSTDPVFTDLERIEAAARDLNSDLAAGRAEEALRGHISNLFASIEAALLRSLIFTTWALTTDHFLERESFAYDPALNFRVLQFIETYAPSSSPELKLRTDGKDTLVPLGAAFARLGKGLNGLVPNDYKRPISQVPEECKLTDRPFAFQHTVPFLDLRTEAQATIVASLQLVSQLTQDESVVKVRNSTIHGNNEFPSRSEISVALERISKLRSQLFLDGLYPRLFNLVTRVLDSLGREELRYESSGEKIVFRSPQWSYAPGLLLGRLRMVMMPVCQTLSSGPLRFTVKPRPGGDPYWDGWPKRWRVKNEYGDSRRVRSDDVAI